jgi:hypothetical protein
VTREPDYAPDMHRYIQLANRILWGVLFALIFAAGFLTALIWKGIS